MKTVKVKVYEFKELEGTARQKALEAFADVNVDYEWWDSVYEDAENIGLKIKGFDIDRGSYCKGEFTEGAYQVANKIVKDHGKDCETFKTASEFIEEWDKLVKKHSDGIKTDQVAEENEYEFDKEADDLEADFLKSICEDYRIILAREYEYLTSEAAIIETIEANRYEFTEDGKFFTLEPVTQE